MKPVYPVDMGSLLIQKFGEHPEIYTDRKGHPGWDWYLKMKSPLYAVGDGIIEFAEYRKSGGYGRETRLRIGKYLIYYGHQSKFLVAAGDRVKRGDRIGLSGGDPNDGDLLDGFSNGPHLHFEIRDTTKPQILPLIGAVDPAIWLNTDLENTSPSEPSQPGTGTSNLIKTITRCNLRTYPEVCDDSFILTLPAGKKFTPTGEIVSGDGYRWRVVKCYIEESSAK